jgi:hypothetical protein
VLLVRGGLQVLGLLRDDARQQGADVGLQFGRMGRLGQVVVRARLEAGDLVVELGLGREHQDGRRLGDRVLAQPARDLVPIHIGHHHIEQNDVRLFLKGLCQALFPVRGRANLIALSLQHQSHQTQGVNVVVNDQDFFRHPAFRVEV